MINLSTAREQYERHGECHGCGQNCCTRLAFPLSAEVLEGDPSLAVLLTWHDAEVRLLGGRFAAAVVTGLRCRALTDEGKCALFGKPERPEMCRTWPHGPWDLDTLGPEGQAACGYSFSEKGAA